MRKSEQFYVWFTEKKNYFLRQRGHIKRLKTDGKKLQASPAMIPLPYLRVILYDGV